MENISYETLEKIGYKGYVLPKDAPEKVLQFGEGNFLRAFVDRFFDMGNEATGWNGKIVMVQPISGALALPTASMPRMTCTPYWCAARRTAIRLTSLA